MKTINDYADLVKEQHALNTTIAPVETDLTSASQAYAVGQKFIYDGVRYQAKTAIAQGAALVLNTNYEAADDVSSEIEALTNKLNNEIVTRSALGAKNILPFDLAEIKALNTNGTWAGNVYTYRDVDFTVNADGTVTANGTATGGNASIKLYNASANYEMLGKKVILNGCPSGGSATTYRIQAYRMGSADGSTGTYFDDGEGTIAFDALNNASGTVGSFAVAVYENATVTNLLFKPMVRLASDPDATYQPYAKTNRELTAENQTLTNNLEDEVETRAILGAHNIGEYYSNVVISTSSNLPYLVYNSDYTNAICLIAKVEAGKEYVFTKSSTHGDRFRIAGFNSLIFSDTTATGIDIVNNSSLTSYTYKNTANYKYIAFYVNNITTAETLDDVQAMICFASDSDKTYQPYAMTNRELTDFATLANRLVSNSSSRIILENTLPSELTNGVYRFDSGRTSGLWAGYGVIVLTLKNSTPNGVQLAFKIGADSDVSSNYVAYRLAYNDTWSNWAKLSGTNVT